ncbi:MAG: ATP-dependent Clp protease ATP-binding subunit [Phycisphaerae bacterium]|nr:ATP-dependent Clp protease ATP-binding subunit [Phycisphaerae bacterium]
MYQHLTETAKDVLKLAQSLAHQDHLEYVGTEHILQAIIQKDTGVAIKVLKNKGVGLDELQDRIAQLVKRSNEETWVVGRLPGSPHFRGVVTLAIKEAEKFQDNVVGSEYLLLGLLRESGCIAEKALADFGITYKDIAGEVTFLKGSPLASNGI